MYNNTCTCTYACAGKVGSAGIWIFPPLKLIWIFPSLEFLKCTLRTVLKYWSMSHFPRPKELAIVHCINLWVCECVCKYPIENIIINTYVCKRLCGKQSLSLIPSHKNTCIHVHSHMYICTRLLLPRNGLCTKFTMNTYNTNTALDKNKQSDP